MAIENFLIVAILTFLLDLVPERIEFVFSTYQYCFVRHYFFIKIYLNKYESSMLI